VLTHKRQQDPEVHVGGAGLLAGRGGRHPLEAAPGRSSGSAPAPTAVESCRRRQSSHGWEWRRSLDVKVWAAVEINEG
jgi:hypothetical protein